MREFFKLKIWKASLVAIAAIILIGSAVVFYELKKETKISQAGAGHNVLGFAWSENIGWISFNSSNCDTDSNSFIDTDAMVQGCGGDNSTDAVFDYGVNVDLAGNGSFSGYAWSSNIDWITFDKAIAGNPPGAPYNAGETFMAKLDTGTGELSGWARALSACQDDLWDGTKCTGTAAGDKSGGWDGWIKLRKDPADIPLSPNYGVSLNTSDFEGWAWGDSVVGWIGFNSANCDADDDGFSDGVGNCPVAGTLMASYKVFLSNFAPTVATVAVLPINYCASNLPMGIDLMWNFNDAEDGFLQTGYEISLLRSDLATCNIVKNPDGSNSITGSAINALCSDFINYGGHTYTWGVKVYDSAGADSGFVWEPSPFPINMDSGVLEPTPAHQYPIANFSYFPVPPPNILQFQPITFDPLTPPDDSRAYGLGIPIVSFEWDFDDDGVVDETTFPADPNVTHSYSETGMFTIDLRVTDSDGYACWASQSTPTNIEVVDIGANIPMWNEINP